jgi:hypothetical protein
MCLPGSATTRLALVFASHATDLGAQVVYTQRILDMVSYQAAATLRPFGSLPGFSRMAWRPGTGSEGPMTSRAGHPFPPALGANV